MLPRAADGSARRKPYLNRKKFSQSKQFETAQDRTIKVGRRNMKIRQCNCKLYTHTVTFPLKVYNSYRWKSCGCTLVSKSIIAFDISEDALLNSC